MMVNHPFTFYLPVPGLLLVLGVLPTHLVGTLAQHARTTALDAGQQPHTGRIQSELSTLLSCSIVNAKIIDHELGYGVYN